MQTEKNVLDILSSDYYPSSLLQAVHLLSKSGHSMPDAVAKISLAPARAAGLDDRGQIYPGLRADLVRVHAQPEQLMVRHVWRNGERVF